MLLADDYVFTSVKPEYDWHHIRCKAMFVEDEGITLIVTKSIASQHNLDFDGLFKCLSLTVHSSLEAVGLTASVSAALANESISANVVAAYHHDHVFVPKQDAEKALGILKKLVRESN